MPIKCMATFRVYGTFKLGSQWQNFVKAVDADRPEGAVNLVVRAIGSNHGCPRRHIQISQVIESEPAKDNP